MKKSLKNIFEQLKDRAEEIFEPYRSQIIALIEKDLREMNETEKCKVKNPSPTDKGST